MGCRKASRRKKRRCNHRKSLAAEVDDLTYLILSFLNLETLFKCCTICKSWNSLINSTAFRKLWCSNAGSKEPHWVVAGSYRNADHFYCWNPSTGYTCKLKAPESRPLLYASVVASAGGLLCVRCKPKLEFDIEDEETAHLMVGNPVTGDWKTLPTFKWDKTVDTFWTLDHRMMVYEGGFRISIQLLGRSLAGHSCCVYDSATNSWRQTEMLRFSREYVKAREERMHENGCDLLPVEQAQLNAFYYDLALVSFYDMTCDKWSTGKLRSLELTTGLECDAEKSRRTCALPRPCHSASRLWEYKGEHYFASAWVFAGGWAELSDVAVDGFGVWKVNQEGGLALVSARLQEDLVHDPYIGLFPVQTDADGDLVCFSCITDLIFTYSLSTDCWSVLNSFHQFHLEKDHDNTVVYQPSLRPVNQARGFS